MTIYLDNAATSFPKPPTVAQAMMDCLQVMGGNPGRASHRMARAAQQILEDTRWRLAKLLEVKNPERVIFTFNATDALNMAIKGALVAGDHVISSKLEHNSLLRPLNNLAKDKISVTYLDFDDSGFIDLPALTNAITPQTRMIAITAASNVLGTLQPLKEMAELARHHNLLFLVDAAQVLGALPLSISELGIDLLAASGHKSLLGPMGTGLLYVAERVTLQCWREGGTGGDSLSPHQPLHYPFQMEAGTPNVVGIAGLKAALDYLIAKDIAEIRNHEMALTEMLLKELAKMPEVNIYGTKEIAKRVSTVAFSVADYRADEVAAILDESFDIAVRGGLHCAPLLHQHLGTSPDGLVRVSIGPFNNEGDIKTLITALQEIVMANEIA